MVVNHVCMSECSNPLQSLKGAADLSNRSQTKPLGVRTNTSYCAKPQQWLNHKVNEAGPPYLLIPKACYKGYKCLQFHTGHGRTAAYQLSTCLAGESLQP